MVEACPVDWTVKRNPNQLEDRDGTWPSVNGWRVSSFQYRNHPQRTEEEARLIASAPALLAACKGMIHHDDALKTDYKIPANLRRIIESAIAQAEGG